MDWISLVFYSAVAASVLNPIAFSDTRTDEAMYLLAINAPEVHQGVVSSILTMSHDKYFQGAAEVYVKTGHLVWGPWAYDGFRFPALKWASVLVHEAKHVQQYREGNDLSAVLESSAILEELKILKLLGANIDWQRERTYWLFMSLADELRAEAAIQDFVSPIH